MPTKVVNRAPAHAVALETTLLLHGVPAEAARGLAEELNKDVRSGGAEPALVGVVSGRPIVGLNDSELDLLLRAAATQVGVPKANTSNLGALLAKGSHAATTVSTTMEFAHAAGLRVFATGGLGGVHTGYGEHLDVSADLAAFTRFPVAVVASGVKGILDVVSTREALESLGVPVVAFQADSFPAFYVRESAAKVDARFEDVATLASYIAQELERTGRGVVVCNPIPVEHEVEPERFEQWLIRARGDAVEAGIHGRAVTPFLLSRLHAMSGGETLRANIALVRSNARLAGRLAAALSPRA